MTAAQIRSAATLVEEATLADSDIVTLIELGSEGAVFYAGTFMNRGPRFLIARDGTIVPQSEHWRGTIAPEVRP